MLAISKGVRDPPKLALTPGGQKDRETISMEPTMKTPTNPRSMPASGGEIWIWKNPNIRVHMY